MKAPKAINIVDQQDCGDKGMVWGWINKLIILRQRATSRG